MSRGAARNNKGISLVFTAICLFVLIMIAALAIDTSRLYIAKQRAQNVADACAIAGAWKLDGTSECTGTAESEAQLIATDNNAQSINHKVFQVDSAGAGVTVDFPTTVTKDSGETVNLDEGEAIRVRCKVPVSYTLAKVAGFSSGSPQAESIVVRQAISSMEGKLVPWALTNTTIWGPTPLPPMSPQDIIITDPKDRYLGPGNFGAITFPNEVNAGKKTYEERVAGTSDVEIDLLSLLNADNRTGNVKAATIDGLNVRISSDMITFQQWIDSGMPNDCPQLVIMPIVEDPLGRHLNTFEVEGFAAYFIETYPHSMKEIENKEMVVRGYFVSGVTNGEVTRWSYNLPGEGNTLISELRLVK